MRISDFSFAASVTLSALVTGCASRSDSLNPVWSDPWAHHGQILNVRVYPHDTGNRSYLACLRPCPNPPTNTLGNSWIVPLDRDAFAGWDGRRPVGLRARVNASAFNPEAFWGHLPIFLEEVEAAGAPAP